MKKTIIYNIKSLPEGIRLEEILEIYHATGLLIYENTKPYTIDADNLDGDVVVINYKEWLNLNLQTQQEDSL